MIRPVVVVLDEGLNPGVKVTGQEVIFQQDSVLQGLVPALDLAWVWGWHGVPRTWLIVLATM